jgi:hypothetical protein
MAYDLIGDVHGCRDELLALLRKLGYAVEASGVRPPAGRTAVFLGDLVNRGPETPGVLRLVMSMIEAGAALCVAGNHDVALAGAIQGRETESADALAESLQQLAPEGPEFRTRTAAFIDALPRRLVLDGGRLIVAHAGLPEEYHGIESEEADRFAVHGRKVPGPGGELVRYFFANDYHGAATVVYGHYSQLHAIWLNRTVCIDTGCVYGGSLTALLYPEMKLVSVPAARVYFQSRRSKEFRAAALAAG